MEDDQVEEVARVQGPVEADLVRGILESNGIRVRTAGRVSHAVLPFSIDGLGEVRILVRRDQAAAARDLLASQRRAGLVVVRGDGEVEEADAAPASERDG